MSMFLRYVLKVDVFLSMELVGTQWCSAQRERHFQIASINICVNVCDMCMVLKRPGTNLVQIFWLIKNCCTQTIVWWLVKPKVGCWIKNRRKFQALCARTRSWIVPGFLDLVSTSSDGWQLGISIASENRPSQGSEMYLPIIHLQKSIVRLLKVHLPQSFCYGN